MQKKLIYRVAILSVRVKIKKLDRKKKFQLKREAIWKVLIVRKWLQFNFKFEKIIGKMRLEKNGIFHFFYDWKHFSHTIYCYYSLSFKQDGNRDSLKSTFSAKLFCTWYVFVCVCAVQHSLKLKSLCRPEHWSRKRV